MAAVGVGAAFGTCITTLPKLERGTKLLTAVLVSDDARVLIALVKSRGSHLANMAIEIEAMINAPPTCHKRAAEPRFLLFLDLSLERLMILCLAYPLILTYRRCKLDRKGSDHSNYVKRTTKTMKQTPQKVLL